MEKSELVKKLEANDPSVRFVPFGYKIGEQSALKLERNPYIIGLVGEEGAQKLAEVSANYEFRPSVFSFENVNEPVTRLSFLRSSNFGGTSLLVGEDVLAEKYSCAFGVFRKTAEGSSQNFSRELR